MEAKTKIHDSFLAFQMTFLNPFLERGCSISSKGKKRGRGEGKGEDGGRNGFIATKSGNYCRGTNFWHRALATARFSDTVKLFRSFHDSFHLSSRDHDKEGWRNGRSSRCDDRHILSPMGTLRVLSPPFRPSMIFPIRDTVPSSFSDDFSKSLRCLLIDKMMS